MWLGEYGFIQNFYSYMFSQNQIVDALVLGNSFIGDELFLEMIENLNVEHLWIALLFNNMLTDRAIGKFF